MAEEIKELIEKIQQEGIQAAETKAQEIKNQAQEAAGQILEKSRLEANRIVAIAKEEAAKTQESTRALLKQAGRDLLLSLRKEINAMLDKITVSHMRQALAPEELVKVIAALIKERHAKEEGNIIVSLNKEDLEKIEKALFSELGDKIKKEVVLKPSDDIAAGFIISYDSGRSHYDFCDKALAEYISAYLKPKLSAVLKTD